MRRIVERTVGLTREQAQRFFEEHKIRCLLAQFVDIHGAAKAKAVPVEHLDMVLTDGAGFAGFALWGFGMGPEGPDYMAVGDLSTLQAIPWMPGYARFICNGVVNRKSYPYCSRVALQAQVARLKERGLTRLRLSGLPRRKTTDDRAEKYEKYVNDTPRILDCHFGFNSKSLKLIQRRTGLPSDSSTGAVHRRPRDREELRHVARRQRHRVVRRADLSL
jgi:hypothetical protein